MRSQIERAIASHLDKKDIKYEYETVKIPFTLTYTPDFIIGDTLIEVKGVLDSPDSSKIKTVLRDKPIIDINGKVWNKFLMVVLIQSESVYYSWTEWRNSISSVQARKYSGKNLCAWCKKFNVSYVPVLQTKTKTDFRYLMEWLKKHENSNEIRSCEDI